MQLILHWSMAILSAFRLVDVFVGDTIWNPMRQRFPSVPWRCVRCMSVWAGVIATGFFLIFPWMNWPLAMSFLYLAYGDWLVQRD